MDFEGVSAEVADLAIKIDQNRSALPSLDKGGFAGQGRAGLFCRKLASPPPPSHPQSPRPLPYPPACSCWTQHGINTSPYCHRPYIVTAPFLSPPALQPCHPYACSITLCVATPCIIPPPLPPRLLSPLGAVPGG
eukprot:625358-Pyramimonas_sp.AAC.1